MVTKGEGKMKLSKIPGAILGGAGGFFDIFFDKLCNRRCICSACCSLSKKSRKYASFLV